MESNDYLQEVLQLQELAPDSEEMIKLQEHRSDVDKLLRNHFSECSPTIRYGGSKAKGTMIREAYDLDIICYFAHDDLSAGETLEEIYNNVRKALSLKYVVETKPSTLRIKDLDPKNYGTDFNIDVVPGRYTDNSKTDVFLYRISGEKKRLKTNLDVHIKHVKESGMIDVIRLIKLWRVRNGLKVKHFALELVIIELLKNRHSSSLSHQIEHAWKEFRDNSDKISIKDPANPTGNDLCELVNTKIRSELSAVAATTLKLIDESGWETAFGPIPEKDFDDKGKKIEILRRAAASVVTPTKPWSCN